MSQTELDSLTIKDFEARYQIARSNVNNRIAGLRQQGYDLEPEKREGRNIYSADQITLMDLLDAHLKAGNPIATFPAAAGQMNSTVSQDKLHLSHRTQDSTYVSQDKSHLSHRPQDSRWDGASLVEAIAGRVVEILSFNRSAPDPLSNLRAIQDACDHGWLLGTSQLAPLLGVKRLTGQRVERYGFTFTRVGRNGMESAWQVKQMHHV